MKRQPPRAVLYTRISTDEQAESGTSLESQPLACAQEAKRLAAEVVTHCQDAGVSGAFYETRPGIQDALKVIEDGRADTLIVHSISRLSRDSEHPAAIRNRVAAAGGRIVFCDMDFAPTPEGDLAFGIMGTFAEYERKVIRGRSMKGRRRRAEEGVQTSRGQRPYGYAIVTRDAVLRGEWPAELLGTYQVVEDEARWGRAMFTRYSEGSSLRQIALYLHRQGVPTPRGGVEWEAETIARILKNPVYKGEPTFGRRVNGVAKVQLSQSSPRAVSRRWYSMRSTQDSGHAATP